MTTTDIARPALVAFDLDDTLAPSKSALDPRMSALLLELLDLVDVAVISGGNFQQFQKQVVDRLGEGSADQFARLHLLPACGTQYYRFGSGEWKRIYSEPLTDDEKQRVTSALESEARRLGYWSEKTWGPVLEDRESQITFSALGQQAPIDAKLAWDPTGAKKKALRSAVAALVPDLEARGGGSTSIDVTRRGIDKAYGMRKLMDATGLELGDLLFVGDRLDPDGNDYPVKAMGVECIPVGGWAETADLLDGLITRWRA